MLHLSPLIIVALNKDLNEGMVWQGFTIYEGTSKTADDTRESVGPVRLYPKIDMHGSIRLAGMADLKG